MKVTVKTKDVELVIEQDMEPVTSDKYYHFTTIADSIAKVIVEAIKADKHRD